MKFRKQAKKIGGFAALVALSAIPLLWAFSNVVQIQQQGEYFLIQSNGIPDHDHGVFPNAGNPNRISEQQYTFRVPAQPKFTGKAQSYGHDLFGVALNGIPFDPGTAEFWNNHPDSGWNYEALSGKINLGIDTNHAHVQPNGAYHYHGIPTGYLAQVQNSEAGKHIGYAADGFPVYYKEGKRPSYQLKKGKRPSGPGGNYDGTFVQDYEYVPGSGDLDACNGSKISENSGGSYRYYLTDHFPFVPRCLMGVADPSFKKQHPHRLPGGAGQGFGNRFGQGRPPGSGDFGARPPRPPQEALDACQGFRAQDACGFQTPRGFIHGICLPIENELACVPDR